MGPLRQGTSGKIVADGAGADTKKVLQRPSPAKRGDDGWKITIFHSDSLNVNLHEVM
jgi:hypothetical protein